MNDPFTSDLFGPNTMKPDQGRLTCDQCRAGLADFIMAVLNGGDLPADTPIPLHLDRCPGCSQAYIHLLDLTTAPQVNALQKALLEPAQAPTHLPGLLLLWQQHLAACNRLEDLRGAAVALSVVGMIRRQQGDQAEAKVVHELALRTAKDSHDLLSRLMSHADLGVMALADERLEEAIEHLEAAVQTAKDLGDQASRTRLWSRLHQTKRRLLDLERRQISLGAQLARLYQGWLQPRYGFAPAGERMLILNTATEIPMKIVAGPEVDQAGQVSLTLTLDRAALAGLPPEFFIDLLFLPTLEIVQTVRIGPEERLSLQAVSGLQLQAHLPGLTDFIEQLRAALAQEGRPQRHFPRTALALQLWWAEEQTE